MINTFLFDLDGTLLPLVQDDFFNSYFYSIAKKFVPLGFDKDQLIKAIWVGTDAMIKNSGEETNEVVFWNTFKTLIKGDYEVIENHFLDFYSHDFDSLINKTKPSEYSKLCIKKLKEKGYKIVIATNPVFPQVATHKRTTWAGLNPQDFELITTYENSRYSKPNLKYYQEILKTINKKPEECIMVGNDVLEDMIVSELNIDTFLLKECLINLNNDDITKFKQGDFKELLEFIDSLPSLI